MLASGYSPVYPAHVPPTEFKTRCVGTGPFKLKDHKLGEYLEFVKNADYFVNFVLHENSIYNQSRMQDIWLDRK